MPAVTAFYTPCKLTQRIKREGGMYSIPLSNAVSSSGFISFRSQACAHVCAWFQPELNFYTQKSEYQSQRVLHHFPAWLASFRLTVQIGFQRKWEGCVVKTLHITMATAREHPPCLHGWQDMCLRHDCKGPATVRTTLF